ncbi:MAG: hypothetical protein QM820_35575 [Minicystis sp.]
MAISGVTFSAMNFVTAGFAAMSFWKPSPESVSLGRTTCGSCFLSPWQVLQPKSA